MKSEARLKKKKNLEKKSLMMPTNMGINESCYPHVNKTKQHVNKRKVYDLIVGENSAFFFYTIRRLKLLAS